MAMCVCRGAHEFKVWTLIYRSFCNLCALALGLALQIFVTVLTSLKKDEEGQNVQLSTVATLLYQFLLCWCLVTPFTSNSINLAVYCLSLNFFLLIRSLIDPTLAVFIVFGPWQFLVSRTEYIIE